MQSYEKILAKSSQAHFFESLVDRESFACKKMFGSVAIYFNYKMVSGLCEGDEESWRGVRYGYKIWNGVLIPTDHSHHQSLKKSLKGTEHHPVLKKWLYLPMESKYYEKSVQLLVDLIKKNDRRIGVFPSVKKIHG